MLCLRSPFLWTLALCIFLGNSSLAQPVLIGVTANSMAVGPTSKIVNIDPMTGAATNPRETGILAIGGIASRSATGEVFGLTTLPSSPANSLIKIDPGTGSWTMVGPTGLSQIGEGDIAFSPFNGQLYGLADGGGDFTQRSLFTLNLSTGEATVVGSLPLPGDYSAMAFASDGTLLVIDVGASGNSRLYRVNPANAAVLGSQLMNLDFGSAAGMTFDPTSGLLYVADGGLGGAAVPSLYQVDALTGIATLVGPVGIPGGIAGLTYINVPEPTSFLLGICGFLAIRRFVKPRRV